MTRGLPQTSDTPLSQRSVRVSDSDSSHSLGTTGEPSLSLEELSVLKNAQRVAAFKSDGKNGGYGMEKWLKEDPVAVGDILKQVSSKQFRSILSTYERNVQSYGAPMVAPLTAMVKQAFPHGSSTLRQVLGDSPEHLADTITTNTIVKSFLGNEIDSETVATVIQEMEASGDMNFWGVKQYLEQNLATAYTMDIAGDDEAEAELREDYKNRLPGWHVTERLADAATHELGTVKGFIELIEHCGDNPRMKPVLKELDKLLFKSISLYNDDRAAKDQGGISGDHLDRALQAATTEQILELRTVAGDRKAALLQQLGWQPLPAGTTNSSATVAIKHNTRNKTIYTGRVAGNCAQQAKNSCS